MVLGDVRRLILATDMTRHAEYVATIDKLRPPETAPAPPPVLQAAALAAAASVVTPETAGAAGCDDPDRSPHPATGLVRDGAGEAARRRRLVGELLLKCADTSNVLRPFPAARRWAVRATVASKRRLRTLTLLASIQRIWVESALHCCGSGARGSLRRTYGQPARALRSDISARFVHAMVARADLKRLTSQSLAGPHHGGVLPAGGSGAGPRNASDPGKLMLITYHTKGERHKVETCK